MWPWYGYWNPWRWGWPVFGMPYVYGYSPWDRMSKEQETAVLEDEARALESELDNIRKRLEELKK